MNSHTQGLLQRTGDANERLISFARIIFSVGVFLRFASLEFFARGPHWQAKTALECVAFCMSVCVSLRVLYFVRRRSLYFWERLLSIGTDVQVCVTLLLSGVLWPWDSYQGILRSPDGATVLVVVVATGFRLSLRLAVVGSAATIACAFALWLLDYNLNRAVLFQPFETLALSMLLLACCSALAVFASLRTEQLVETAGTEAARRAHAVQRLDVLLQTQHDLRSLLASATLSAGLVREGLEFKNPEALEISRELERDLNELANFINQNESVRQPVESVGIVELQETIDSASRHVPGLAFDSKIELHAEQRFLVAGGKVALFRVLLNAFLNARDGNGTSGAQRVGLRARVVGSFVSFEIEDDGPGFPSHVLSQKPSAGATTKASGSGLGLTLVSWVVEESQGALLRENHQSGARVTVTFPREQTS
jgi:signal transduction histidine kinase